jgi:formate dehydrogenase iron-sulfur subunit
MGVKDAQLYGADKNGPLGGLNAFFLLIGAPSKYGLPEQPKLPQRNVVVDSIYSIGAAIAVGLGAVFAFRGRGRTADAGDDVASR